MFSHFPDSHWHGCRAETHLGDGRILYWMHPTPASHLSIQGMAAWAQLLPRWDTHRSWEGKAASNPNEAFSVAREKTCLLHQPFRAGGIQGLSAHVPVCRFQSVLWHCPSSLVASRFGSPWKREGGEVFGKRTGEPTGCYSLALSALANCPDINQDRAVTASRAPMCKKGAVA